MTITDRNWTRDEVVARLKVLRKEEDRLITLHRFAKVPEDIEWRLERIEAERAEFRSLFHDITLHDLREG